MRLTLCVVLAAAAAGAVLPGEVLVTSPQYVEPSPSLGVWYLGPSPAGYLYLAMEKALPRLAPYRLRHDDPETSTYYLAYEYAPGAAERAAAFGEVEALGEGAYLLAVPRGGEATLAVAGLPVQLVLLTPRGRPRPGGGDDEPPPAYDAAVDTALKKITKNRVRGYLQTLQDFGTRFSYAEEFTDAGKWAYDFFGALGYDVSYDEFLGIGFDAVSMPTDGRRAWVVTDGGTIFRTTNRGNTWARQEAPAKGFLWSLQFLNENVGYAVGAGGTCLKTSNGGTKWNAQNVPYAGYLFGVAFANASQGWIAADGGRIFHTSNGGTSWSEQTTPTTQRLYDVSMVDATHGWACGRGGAVLYTDDGQTWTLQPTNTASRLYGIYAVSATEAWGCGWDNSLLHTTDGGQIWTQVSSPAPAGTYFYDIRFGDASHGYVVGLDGAFLFTDDGGATWKYKKISDEDFQGCDFASGSFGMITGSAALYRTDDGGSSFESLLDNFSAKWSNVVAEKRGRTDPDEIVIVCGHMDCTSEKPLESAPGAEDNGSGTTATLAAAYALADLDFRRTLRFICWAGEEQGLLGSWHYARKAAENNENIVGVVNLDMVAYDEEKGQRDDTNSVGNDASRWLAEYLAEAAAVYGINHYFDVFVDPNAGRSDHASFWAVGYEAIFLIEGASGGPGQGMEYPWYHTTQDTIDNLSMKIEVDCARAATATAAHLARPYATPHVTEPTPPAAPRPFAVFPNPYKRGAGPGYVRFDGLGEGATIELFDLAGRRIFRYDVRGGEEHYDWPVVASDGEAAASSGVYLYRVTGAGLDERGKLAVIR